MRAALTTSLASALLVHALAACGSSGSAPDKAGGADAGGETCGDGGCVQVAAGWTDCSDGFISDGAGCTEVAPSAPCAPGSYPVLGQTDCQPVGVASCSAGFAPDPSGWGCVAVIAPVACAGATYEALGQTSCAPVGDCNAPFPPASATHFVDPAAPVDATHFKTIGDALAAAPAGATVAIAPGTYAEALTPTRAVTLVGRCAAQVTLQGSVAAAPGVKAVGVTGVTLRGLTVSGFEVGVDVEGGAQVTITDSIVTGNRRSGLLAADSGTTLTVSHSALRANVPDASGRFGMGASVGYGALLTVTESAIAQNGDMGITAQKGGRATVTRSVIRGTLPRAGDGVYGFGLAVDGASAMDAHDCAVLDSHTAGVVVSADGSTLTVSGGAITGVASGNDTTGKPFAAGAASLLGAVLKLDGVTITGSDHRGIYTAQTAQTEVKRSLIRAIASNLTTIPGSGVHTEGSAKTTIDASAIVDLEGLGFSNIDTAQTTITGSLVQNVRFSSSLGGGAGAQIEGGSVTASSIAILGCAGAGFGVLGTGTTADVRGAIVRSTDFDKGGALGYGFAVDEGGVLTIDRAAVVDNREAALYASNTGTHLAASRVVLRATRLGEGNKRGRAVNVQFGATADLSKMAGVDNVQVGIFAYGAGTVVTLADALVRGTKADPLGGFGHALEVLEGAHLKVERAVMSNNVGIGLVVAAAQTTVAASRVDDNAVGVHVQDGSQLAEVATIPDTVGDLDVDISADTTFSGNGTRVGSGEVPLPEAIGAPTK